jgi:hypothetical protein
METIWGIVGVSIPVLLTIGFGIAVAGAGMTRGEFLAARICFYLSAAMLGSAEMYTLLMTEQPFWFRSMAGLMVGALLFVGLPESVRWVNKRQELANPPPPITGAVAPSITPPLAPPLSPAPAPRSRLPLKSYDSPKEKEEIVSGLQDLRKSLNDLKIELKEKADRIGTSYESMGLRAGILRVRFVASDQGISDTIAAIQDFGSVLNRISANPVTRNSFLDDRSYSEESGYVMDIQKYHSIVNSVSNVLPALRKTMMQVKLVFKKTNKDAETAGQLMEAVPSEVQAISGSLLPFNEWVSGVDSRADEMRKHLPSN